MPSGRQVVPDLVECLRREEERLEAEVRRGADQRQRIGQGEDHEVVLARAAPQERPPVVVDPGHARIVVRPVRVVADTDLLDLRVDLDRVDMLGAVLERHRDVRAGAGPDDQHALERPLREPAIDLLVERVDRAVDRPHRLVRDPVDVDAPRCHRVYSSIR